MIFKCNANIVTQRKSHVICSQMPPPLGNLSWKTPSSPTPSLGGRVKPPLSHPQVAVLWRKANWTPDS